MGWTYRVVKREEENPLIGGVETIYFISEVYDSGGYTQHSDPIGSTPFELRLCLARMLEAFEKPVLVERDGKLEEVR